jgi:uncharacterized protein
MDKQNSHVITPYGIPPTKPCLVGCRLAFSSLCHQHSQDLEVRGLTPHESLLSRQFGSLRNRYGKCSYHLMPWDFWLIFLVLGVLIPWRGRVRLRRLMAQPVVSTKEKLVLYGGTIAFQWLWAAAVAWRAFARGLTYAELGLTRVLSVDLLLFSFAGALLLGAFQWFNLRKISHLTGAVPEFTRNLASRILPVGSLELAPYLALAVTAGICEEFLYRGFAMAALARAGITSWAVVIISSLLFGFAHTYQGRSGVWGTTFMGLVFGAARIALGSLVPVVIWHSAVDIAAGIAGPKYLLAVQKAE